MTAVTKDRPPAPEAGRSEDDLVPPHVREIQPYVPGKPIEELARELGLSDPSRVVKLASNENPLGPSPRAVAALIQAAHDVHRYPESSSPELTWALAERLGVEPGQILLGNGSNEVIELAVRTFCTRDDEAVISQYSFAMMKVALQVQAIPTRIAPARGYAYDLDAMLELVTPRTRLVYLDNPNNPTGSCFGRAQLERFLEQLSPLTVVLLDEAYLEFVQTDDYPAGTDYIGSPTRAPAHPRLMLARTFSKAHGLAGLRVGFAVAPKPMIDLMNRVREPFNVNVLAQKAALAALGDEAHLARSRTRAIEGVAYLTRALSSLGVKVEPSETNFVLVDLGFPARPIYEALLRRAVITRPLSAYGLHNHLRINVGHPDEDVRLVAELHAVLRQ
jgi:histidinol-phosphate aminotransferase